MFALISDIVNAVKFANLNLQTIKDIEIIGARGARYDHSIGNNAVVFRVKIEGRYYAMRCYRRPKPYLRELYGDDYYPNELNVGGVVSTKYVDVVLCDWVEGRSLSKCVEEAITMGDGECLSRLATTFDHFALWLVNEEWAHGDLSPDNIIVDQSGQFHLIDLDARYIPQLSGCESSELGTQAYQSPNRTGRDFNSRIDDFSIIIISSSLHALSLDTTLNDRYPFLDGLLLDGQRVGDLDYEVANYVMELFASNGYFKQYRALKSLRMNTLKIDALPQLLSCNSEYNDDLEMFISWGLCGYVGVDSGELIIPPLFDEAFEFRGEYALVRLSTWWYYIDKSGCAVESCGEWGRGKPSRVRV